MKPLFKQRLIHLLILTTLVTLGCRLPFNLISRLRGPVEPITSQPEVSDAADRVEFVMPEIPGKSIPLETGGSVFVPQGALPEGTQIKALLADSQPVLREGMRQVGEALIITADVQPDQPILLRLPIPPGVDNPENLAIMRTSTNGMTTFLVTWVDSDHLAAYTTGFSRFSMVEFIGSFLDDHRVKIAGGGDLLTGQTHTLYISPILSTRILDSTWNVNDKATILNQGDQSVTIQAGNEPGVIIIEYVAINLTYGERWYGSTRLMVRQPSPDLDSGLRIESFRIGLTTDSTVVHEGELFNAQVSFHGLYEYPVTWTYEVIGCQDRVSISTNSQPVSLPSMRCDSHTKLIYRLVVTAEDSSGKRTSADQVFRVLHRPFMAKVFGDGYIGWAEGGVRGVFEALTNDTFSQPPYTYSWRTTPGGDWSPGESVSGISTRAIIFDQPGEHLVEVQVTDSKGNAAKAVMPVMVWGADPLDAHILSWPDSIQPGEEVSMLFRVGGGTRLLSGQMTGYRVFVGWADGSPFFEENNVGIGSKGYAPIIFPLSHQWASPGTYTVTLILLDHAGGSAFSFADVVVGGETAADDEVIVGGEVTPETSEGSGRWVLQGSPVINRENDPLNIIENTHCYFADHFKVSETHFEWLHINEGERCDDITYTITTLFDAPPAVLIPGQEIPLTANFFLESTWQRSSMFGVFSFRYDKTSAYCCLFSYERSLFNNIYEWYYHNPDFPDTVTWTLWVPEYLPGNDIFEVVAEARFVFKNPLNVTWTYKFEP